MKVRKLNNMFQPVSLVLTIETEQELVDLLRRLHLNEDVLEREFPDFYAVIDTTTAYPLVKFYETVLELADDRNMKVSGILD